MPSRLKVQLAALVMVTILLAATYTYIASHVAEKSYAYNADTLLVFQNPNTNETIRAEAKSAITITILERSEQTYSIKLRVEIRHERVKVEPSKYAEAFGFSNKTLEASINTNTCSLVESGVEIQPTIDQFYCNISAIDEAMAESKGFAIHREGDLAVIGYSNTTGPLKIEVKAAYSLATGLLRYYRAHIYSDSPSKALGIKEIREDITLHSEPGGPTWLARLILVALVASASATILQVYRYLRHRPGGGDKKHEDAEGGIEEEDSSKERETGEEKAGE
ncbi:hypothetical protein [Pyrodictium abyssi]|uniref:hypothetical protein n=1 Tax=Pyrodictium abyssi TaxID=54256 RepID=UPI0030C722F6